MEKINSQKEIASITGQIIKLINPQKIILFGSSVKNGFQENGDLDFCVVVKNNSNIEKLIAKLNFQIKTSVKCDFIVSTEEEMRQFKNNITKIHSIIHDEGKTVYKKLPV